MKITKEQLRKMARKARREAALQNSYRPSVAHKTSKKDKAEKLSNTVRSYE